MAATIIRDQVPLLLKVVEDLTRQEVLVGVPGKTTDRKAGTMTNAYLAYIHEFGVPARNIPARPFLRPGINAVMDRIVAQLRSGAQQALNFPIDPEAGTKALHRVGLTAQNGVRAYLNRGVPPPLARSTVEARARRFKRRQGPRQELARRDAGLPAGVDLVKPLIETGQLRNSITYVIRRR